jgi:hypothetical protein
MFHQASTVYSLDLYLREFENEIRAYQKMSALA